jgi:hypothetical protein
MMQKIIWVEILRNVAKKHFILGTIEKIEFRV